MSVRLFCVVCFVVLYGLLVLRVCVFLYACGVGVLCLVCGVLCGVE